MTRPHRHPPVEEQADLGSLEVDDARGEEREHREHPEEPHFSEHVLGGGEEGDDPPSELPHEDLELAPVSGEEEGERESLHEDLALAEAAEVDEGEHLVGEDPDWFVELHKGDSTPEEDDELEEPAVALPDEVSKRFDEDEDEEEEGDLPPSSAPAVATVLERVTPRALDVWCAHVAESAAWCAGDALAESEKGAVFTVLEGSQRPRGSELVALTTWDERLFALDAGGALLEWRAQRWAELARCDALQPRELLPELQADAEGLLALTPSGRLWVWREASGWRADPSAPRATCMAWDPLQRACWLLCSDGAETELLRRPAGETSWVKVARAPLRAQVLAARDGVVALGGTEGLALWRDALVPLRGARVTALCFCPDGAGLWVARYDARFDEASVERVELRVAGHPVSWQARLPAAVLEEAREQAVQQLLCLGEGVLALDGFAAFFGVPPKSATVAK